MYLCSIIAITYTNILEVISCSFLKVIDNGKGVTNNQRLLSWTSKESSSVHNRYGTGSKLCLTKWNNNYNAKWYVRYRTCDKKNKSGSNRITKTEAQQSMLNRKQKKLVTRLNTAYCRTGKMERILPILTGKSKISLRLIDWFVTNYAKIFNTHYSITEYKIKREGKIKRGKTVAPKTHKKIKL